MKLLDGRSCPAEELTFAFIPSRIGGVEVDTCRKLHFVEANGVAFLVVASSCSFVLYSFC